MLYGPRKTRLRTLRAGLYPIDQVAFRYGLGVRLILRAVLHAAQVARGAQVLVGNYLSGNKYIVFPPVGPLVGPPFVARRRRLALELGNLERRFRQIHQKKK